MTAFDLIRALIGDVVDYASGLPETQAGRDLRAEVHRMLVGAAAAVAALPAQQEAEHAEVNGRGGDER